MMQSVFSVCRFLKFPQIHIVMKAIWGPVPRIIVIGDLHGDWQALIRCLMVGRVINGSGQWTGGRTHVVQIGDILDRANRSPTAHRDENSEFRMYHYLDQLDQQATRAGGKVHMVIGNHELMNVGGDFTYVSPQGLMAFGGPHGRAQALRPGSPFARFLALRAVPALKIGQILFAHAGPTPAIVNHFTIGGAHKAITNYLLGKTPFPEALSDLFWTREYSDPSQFSETARQSLVYCLQYWRATTLVVGHTPQSSINSDLGGRLWRVDTGSSGAFAGPRGVSGPAQVLEIMSNRVFRVLGDRSTIGSPHHPPQKSPQRPIKKPPPRPTQRGGWAHWFFGKK